MSYRVLGSRSCCYFCLVSTNHSIYFLRVCVRSFASLGALPYLSESLKKDAKNSKFSNELFVLLQSSRRCHQNPWLATNRTPCPFVDILKWYRSACLDSERQHCLPNSITNVRCLYIASQAIEIFQERCLEENPPSTGCCGFSGHIF